MNIVHCHHLSYTVSTACSPGGAESCFMLSGFLEFYSGRLAEHLQPSVKKNV